MSWIKGSQPNGRGGFSEKSAMVPANRKTLKAHLIQNSTERKTTWMYSRVGDVWPLPWNLLLGGFSDERAEGWVTPFTLASL